MKSKYNLTDGSMNELNSEDASISTIGSHVNAVDLPEPKVEDKIFIVYRRRWLVLMVVVILNISNAALWITYAPVSTIVATFYEKTPSAVNFFSVAYLLVSIPFCFVCTYAVNKLGLGPAIHAGALLNMVGAVVKAIGTSAFVGSASAKYGISLAGQVVSAMAQSFLLFIPTKVSQIWFPEHQRTISTTLLSMSNPLGIVVAQVMTPLIVREVSDVPLNNYIWMALAVLGEITTLAIVTRSSPPTPASRSSERSEGSRAPYLQQLRDTLTCIPYLLLLLMIGFGIAYLSAMATVTQQMLCGLGYTTSFSGMVTGLLIVVGFAGSAMFGVYVDKTKQFTLVCKICYAMAALMGIGMMEFYLQPDQKAAIVIFSSLFGFFGVGGYPIGLELAVEATYPVEETISTAFIFLSGQLQGVVLIALIEGLSTDQRAEYESIQLCSVGENVIKPRDYSMSMIAMMCMLTLFVSLLIAFFNTKYKRQEAEKKTKLVPQTAISQGAVESSTTISSSILDNKTIQLESSNSELDTRRNSDKSGSVDMFHTTVQ